MANFMENGMLEKWHDFHIDAVGKNRTTLKIRSIVVDRPFAYNFIREASDSMKDKGFIKVILTNGDTTWSYNLTKSKWERWGSPVLSGHSYS